MTRSLPIIGKEKAQSIWHILSASPAAEPRAQSGVYDYLFYLYNFFPIHHDSILAATAKFITPRKWELRNYIWNVGQRSSV